MEGIPAPDVAGYRRKKEQELGLAPGTFGGLPGQRQQNERKSNFENRIYTYEELKTMLETHKALMGRSEDTVMADGASGAVLHAGPQTYAVPPMHAMPGTTMPPFPPGLPFPPPGMSLPPPGTLPPGGHVPPFPPGVVPPFPPP